VKTTVRTVTFEGYRYAGSAADFPAARRKVRTDVHFEVAADRSVLIYLPDEARIIYLVLPIDDIASALSACTPETP
jgi:hypothetical protein